MALSPPNGMKVFLNSPGNRLFEVVIEATADTKRIANVLHFWESSIGGAASGKNDCLALIVANLFGLYVAALSVEWVATRVRCREVDDTTDAYVDDVTVAGTTGAVAGDCQPDFSAVTLRLGNIYRGRSFRGSQHLSPIAESSTLLQSPTAAEIVLVNAIGTWLLANQTLGAGHSTFQAIILSRHYSDLPLGSGQLAGSRVTTMSTAPKLGTMRHRRVKV